MLISDDSLPSNTISPKDLIVSVRAPELDLIEVFERLLFCRSPFHRAIYATSNCSESDHQRADALIQELDHKVRDFCDPNSAAAMPTAVIGLTWASLGATMVALLL